MGLNFSDLTETVAWFDTFIMGVTYVAFIAGSEVFKRIVFLRRFYLVLLMGYGGLYVTDGVMMLIGGDHAQWYTVTRRAMEHMVDWAAHWSLLLGYVGYTGSLPVLREPLIRCKATLQSVWRRLMRKGG